MRLFLSPGRVSQGRDYSQTIDMTAIAHLLPSGKFWFYSLLILYSARNMHDFRVIIASDELGKTSA